MGGNQRTSGAPAGPQCSEEVPRYGNECAGSVKAGSDRGGRVGRREDRGHRELWGGCELEVKTVLNEPGAARGVVLRNPERTRLFSCGRTDIVRAKRGARNLFGGLTVPQNTNGKT